MSKSYSVFEWREPPPHRAKRRWTFRLAPLRDHPWRWAYMGQHFSDVPSRINNGKFSGVEVGEYEAYGAGLGGGLVDLYVRYIGEEEEE